MMGLQIVKVESRIGLSWIESHSRDMRLERHRLIVIQEDRALSCTFKHERLSSEQQVAGLKAESFGFRVAQGDPFHRRISEPWIGEQFAHVDHLHACSANGLGPSKSIPRPLCEQFAKRPRVTPHTRAPSGSWRWRHPTWQPPPAACATSR